MATTNKNFKVKNGLEVGGNTVITGDANVTGKLSITASAGDEGGEIFLSNAATNTTITNGVTIDVYQNRLRFFEQGGDARGYYIDITGGGSGVSTNLVGGGSASNSFATVSANGTSVVADSSTDTITITPGSGMSIVGNATSDTVTFSVDYAEKIYYLVRNNTGSTIPKGTLVSASGAEPSGRIDVAPHSTTGTQDSELRVMGMATANISNGVNGEVISFGTLVGIDTRGDTASAIAVGDETWAEGDILYAHPTVAGKLTKVRPQHDLAVAFITVRHASTGQIAVRIIPGNHHLEWLHDVAIDGTPADNELLAYNSASSLWINQTAEEAGVANLSGATFTGNVAGTNISMSGNVNATTVNATTFIGSGASLTSIPNSATTANSANGASTIVARNATGSFNGNVITASLFSGFTANISGKATLDSLKTNTAANIGGTTVTAATALTVIANDDGESQGLIASFNNPSLSQVAYIDSAGAINTSNYFYASSSSGYYGDGSSLTGIPNTRNYLINGGFDFWQRGTSSTANAVYIADRWIHSRTAGTHTVSQSTDTPTAADVTYSLSFASTSGTNPTITQRIESVNSVQFSSQRVILSVWAKSTTGTAGLSWSTSYPNATDNWASETADTSGTFTASMTVGTWTRYTANFVANALSTRGYAIKIFRNVTTTSTTTLYAGVQLETNNNVNNFGTSYASTFKRAGSTYTEEQMACFRYYQRHITILGTTDSTNVWKVIGNPIGELLRATPTSVIVGTLSTPGAGGNIGTNVTLTLSGRDMYYTSTGSSSNGAWINFDDVKVECEL